MAGSPGERAGTLHERVTDVLHGRTVVERALILHERAAALGALHERVALHASAEVSALRERAGGTVVEKTCCVVGPSMRGMDI